MRITTQDIRVAGSNDSAHLQLYLLDNSPELAIQSRPMVIVCPGGGYHTCSDREAESIAIQFNAMGYHAAVLYYSVAPAVFPAAMKELGCAVRTCRENAGQWNIDPDKIVLTGFSAGGHLAASYSVNWNEDWYSQTMDTEKVLLKPNAMILGYPVILTEDATFTSFQNLLGDAYPKGMEQAEIIQKISGAVPRTFIWATYEDAVVPVRHSLVFAQALAEKGIPVELHIFERGPHGLALSNRVTQRGDGYGVNGAAEKWIGLVRTWLEIWSDSV